MRIDYCGGYERFRPFAFVGDSLFRILDDYDADWTAGVGIYKIWDKASQNGGKARSKLDGVVVISEVFYQFIPFRGL